MLIVVQVLLYFLDLSQEPNIASCEANLWVQKSKQTRNKRAEVKRKKNKHEKKNKQEKKARKKRKQKQNTTPLNSPRYSWDFLPGRSLHMLVGLALSKRLVLEGGTNRNLSPQSLF